jgi:predicted component of type VI protein secretion system
VTGALVVKSGPLAGRRYDIEAEVVLGREDAALTIEDPEISRRHALVRPSGGGLEIEDAGSRNGTFVNGIAVSGATRLSAGDEITVGTTVLTVELARGNSAATAVSASPPTPRQLDAPVPPPAPAPPAPALTPSSAPTEPFGTYAAPAAAKASRGKIASRTLLPMALSIGIVAATAVTLVVYFAQH